MNHPEFTQIIHSMLSNFFSLELDNNYTSSQNTSSFSIPLT
jgi:hypothetical protein